MPIMRMETPENYSPEDAKHLPQELQRLQEMRIADAAAALGPQAIVASMEGETKVREFGIYPAIGEEGQVVVTERTVDNFWLHKPA